MEGRSHRVDTPTRQRRRCALRREELRGKAHAAWEWNISVLGDLGAAPRGVTPPQAPAAAPRGASGQGAGGAGGGAGVGSSLAHFWRIRLLAAARGSRAALSV